MEWWATSSRRRPSWQAATWTFRGYVVYQVQGRRVCVVCTPEGLQVYLDGTLLKEADGERSKH